MKTVLAIHDLSCYAKSSLTVVVPTLSAMGIEVSPLPTALLSTQTDGFSNYFYKNLHAEQLGIIDHWKTLDLSFDAIYSGFLGNVESIDILLDILQWQKEAHPLIIVDPVMGDNGSLYQPITKDFVHRMKHLSTLADVITPNITEAALLLGEEYQHDIDVTSCKQWAMELAKRGPRFVVITSVLEDNNSMVVSYDKENDSHFVFSQEQLPLSYPGCGDLFTSILCGQLLHETEFSEAVATAAQFVKIAIQKSHSVGLSQAHGVSPEQIVFQLATLHDESSM
jgi:pyridoxine kinase